MERRSYIKVNTEDQLKTDKDGSEKDDEGASFEEAIAATGYGKFNIFLLLSITIPCFVQMFESLNLSYVVPVAHCDLELRLEDKGILNAVCFIGMIISGPFWGYLCDTLGRKKIIVYGYVAESILAILASFSTSFTFLLFTKFFIGLILNGPYSASISHFTEFHSSQYRSRVQLFRGIILSSSNMFLPILAWMILPRGWIIKMGGFDFHSWNIFLLACAVLPLSAAIVYSFQPESPKYLMSAGRNEEAMEVFRRVYASNTKEDGINYPIKLLEEETNVKEKTKTSKMKILEHGLKQMEPLFRTPYLALILISCFNAFSISTSSNTLKIWMPQFFQAISDYHVNHNGTGSSLCNMLEEMTSHNTSSSDNTTSCSVNLDNMSVYTSSITVSLVRIGAFMPAIYLNKFISSKLLAILLSLGNAIVSGVLYFAQDSATVVALSSLVSGFGSIVDVILVNIALELFPTTLRTFAVSLHLTASRLGMLFGNILLPYLLYSGCAPSFLFIALIGICCTIFSFLYPNTDNRPLL